MLRQQGRHYSRAITKRGIYLFICYIYTFIRIFDRYTYKHTHTHKHSHRFRRHPWKWIERGHDSKIKRYEIVEDGQASAIVPAAMKRCANSTSLVAWACVSVCLSESQHVETCDMIYVCVSPTCVSPCVCVRYIYISLIYIFLY